MKNETDQGTEILIFARYPQSGRCKTRLAAGMGEANALRVYEALLAHTLKVAQETPYRKVLLVDPPGRTDDAHRWAPGMDLYFEQSYGDLGMRMEQAMDAAFDRGAKNLLFIGCDCPQISKASLTSAVKALAHCQVVLGPTEDGGYYLLGLKNRHRSLFREIPWSTAAVFKETLNILEIQTLSYFSLETFSDVDTLDDFNRVRHLEPLKHLGTR